MMSKEQKLKNFERAAILKAEQQRDGINAELDKQTSEALSVCQKSVRREAAKVRGKGIAEARKEARLIVSTAQNKGQSDIMATRNEIIGEVFSKLVERLREFTASEKYRELFAKRLEDALNAAMVYLGESNARIYIEVTEADAATRASLIESICDRIVVWAHAETRVTEEDIIGGCVISVPSLGLVIDNSIRADVLRERDDFLSWSNLSLS